jgi:hypothetical protein
MRSANQIVREALKQELDRLLVRLSQPQRNVFDCIFPTGSASLSEGKLRQAVDLCQRTVLKNEADPSRLIR